jgi:hypothetical protein
MGRRTESGRAPRRRIDTEAKTRFLEGLRAGLPRDEAARAVGFTANAFYYACGKDPVFALARTMALELSAAAGRAARGARAESPPLCEVTITPTGGRLLQKRHIRRVTFDDRRKRLFLDHFAGTTDAEAACEAAGICYSTYTRHRRTDPEFAAGCAEALAIGYADMEAESLRGRREAQRNLRDGICPAGEAAKEFERQMKLLERYERKHGGIGPRSVPHGAQQRWDFDDAIALFGKRLRAYGLRRGIIPPDAEGDAGAK